MGHQPHHDPHRDLVPAAAGLAPRRGVQPERRARAGVATAVGDQLHRRLPHRGRPGHRQQPLPGDRVDADHNGRVPARRVLAVPQARSVQGRRAGGGSVPDRPAGDHAAGADLRDVRGVQLAQLAVLDLAGAGVHVGAVRDMAAEKLHRPGTAGVRGGRGDRGIGRTADAMAGGDPAGPARRPGLGHPDVHQRLGRVPDPAGPRQQPGPDSRGRRDLPVPRRQRPGPVRPAGRILHPLLDSRPGPVLDQLAVAPGRVCLRRRDQGLGATVAKIVLEGVTKRFKGATAVDDLDLEVEDGEFLVIVGPSGCGKTTTLRMLAGFDTPTSGSVMIGGKRVNAMPPKDRNLAMVFQNYALFPHMTVAKNLSFGMKIRHEPKATIESEIARVADMLGIEPLLGRKPSQLSGGERQRVALGRALLRKPQAFLLDEPLSNLDAALRTQMRFELKRIHAQFPVTTVYVTHDQVEAMTMADRIVLMNHGELQQVAPPETLYAEPLNVFAAGFIGSPKINLVSARIDYSGGAGVLHCLATTIPMTTEIADQLRSAQGETVTIGIRPE